MAKTIEATFRSKWLKKKGKVRIKARREGRLGVNILVEIDGNYYVETVPNIPWKISSLLIRNPGRTADIIIFKERCVVADGEIWLLQDNDEEWYTVHCLTTFDYRNGMKACKTLSKEEIVKAIDEEPPF